MSAEVTKMLEEMQQTRLDRDQARTDLKRMIDECDALKSRQEEMKGEAVFSMSNERLLEVSKAKLSELYEIYLPHCFDRAKTLDRADCARAFREAMRGVLQALRLSEIAERSFVRGGV